MKLKDGKEITVSGADLNEGLQYGATRSVLQSNIEALHCTY